MIAIKKYYNTSCSFMCYKLPIAHNQNQSIFSKERGVLHTFGCIHEHRHSAYSTRAHLRGESAVGQHCGPDHMRNMHQYELHY